MFICLNSLKKKKKKHNSIRFDSTSEISFCLSVAVSPREDKIIEIVEKLFGLEKDGPDRPTKAAPFRIINHENVLKEHSLDTQMHPTEMFTLRVFTTVE
jgi:hypothetical protein